MMERIPSKLGVSVSSLFFEARNVSYRRRIGSALDIAAYERPEEAGSPCNDPDDGLTKEICEVLNNKSLLATARSPISMTSPSVSSIKPNDVELTGAEFARIACISTTQTTRLKQSGVALTLAEARRLKPDGRKGRGSRTETNELVNRKFQAELIPTRR